MSNFTPNSGVSGANVLSIALIGPEEQRRKQVSKSLAEPQGGTVREYSFYPDLSDVPRLLEHSYDVVVVDLDSDPEYALKLVESVSGKGPATVMVYSEQADSGMVVRSMRAGAREFLTLPFAADTMSEALSRVRGSVRGKEVRPLAGGVRIPHLEPRPAAPESRSYDLGTRQPEPRVPVEPRTPVAEPRIPVSESRPFASEPRAFEPAARASSVEPRSSAPEMRPFNSEIRSFEPAPRTPITETRAFEPAARIPVVEPRSTPEVSTFSPEPRAFDPAPRVPAAGGRATAPEVRTALPETRPFNSGNRLSTHGSRLSTHGSRVPSPEPRAAAPEARVAAPEARVATPEPRKLDPAPRAAVPVAPAVPAVPAVAPRTAPKTGGKLITFLGAKGGAGTTSIASNFAVSLAEESGKKTLLIDYNLPLGNVALELGVTSQYSILDALKNSTRLDPTFLSKLLVKHRSGLFVLAAPDTIVQSQVSNDTFEKLMVTARQEFDFVVVDAGTRHDLAGSVFLDDSSTLFLITQDGLPELRNSNRLITEFFVSGGPKVEIVLNRYVSRTESNGMYSSHLVDDKHITKALTRQVGWKIPQDPSESVLMAVDSPVSRAIRAMAREVCGLPAVREEKKKFSLFPQKKKAFKFLD